MINRSQDRSENEEFKQNPTRLQLLAPISINRGGFSKEKLTSFRNTILKSHWFTVDPFCYRRWFTNTLYTRATEICAIKSIKHSQNNAQPSLNIKHEIFVAQVLEGKSWCPWEQKLDYRKSLSVSSLQELCMPIYVTT